MLLDDERREPITAGDVVRFADGDQHGFRNPDNVPLFVDQPSSMYNNGDVAGISGACEQGRRLARGVYRSEQRRRIFPHSGVNDTCGFRSGGYHLAFQLPSDGGATVKKFVLLAAAFVLLRFADAANAADMALKAHPADPSSAYNWSGWYLGLNAGGNWGTSQTSTTIGNGTTGIFLLPVAVNGINGIGMPTDFNTRGFTGGTHGGYNYQMGHWLLGVEADFEYLRSAGSNTVTGFVVPGLPATIATSLGTDWLFTLRPRLGLIFGSWLFYGTGGLAITRLSANWSFVSTGAAESASASATEPGWAAGGGVANDAL